MTSSSYFPHMARTLVQDYPESGLHQQFENLSVQLVNEAGVNI